jgi:hypothetical protein
MTCGTSAAAWRVMFTHAAMVATGSPERRGSAGLRLRAALGDLHGLVRQVGERGLVLHVLTELSPVTP